MHKRDRRKNPKETEFHELCDSTLVFSSFYEESVPLVHGIFTRLMGICTTNRSQTNICTIRNLKKERAVTTRLRVTLPKFAIPLGYANLRTHQNHYRSG